MGQFRGENDAFFEDAEKQLGTRIRESPRDFVEKQVTAFESLLQDMDGGKEEREEEQKLEYEGLEDGDYNDSTSTEEPAVSVTIDGQQVTKIKINDIPHARDAFDFIVNANMPVANALANAFELVINGVSFADTKPIIEHALTTGEYDNLEKTLYLKVNQRIINLKRMLPLSNRGKPKIFRELRKLKSLQKKTAITAPPLAQDPTKPLW